MIKYLVIILALILIILVVKLRGVILLRFDIPTKIINIFTVISLLVIVSSSGLYFYKHNFCYIDITKIGTFKSNKESKFSQTWLDYLSYRDMQIGRLGSIDAFNKYIESRNISEKEYAEEAIKEILISQGVSHAEKFAKECVEENMEK